jgi:hypothetical protein
MALDHLRRGQTGSISDSVEVRRDLRVVTHGQSPKSARILRRNQRLDHLVDAFHQHRRRQSQRLVEHRQRSESRNRFDQPRGAALIQLVGEGQNDHIEIAINAVAEFDDDRGIPGVQEAAFDHGSKGLLPTRFHASAAASTPMLTEKG